MLFNWRFTNFQIGAKSFKSFFFIIFPVSLHYAKRHKSNPNWNACVQIRHTPMERWRYVGEIYQVNDLFDAYISEKQIKSNPYKVSQHRHVSSVLDRQEKLWNGHSEMNSLLCAKNGPHVGQPNKSKTTQFF